MTPPADRGHEVRRQLLTAAVQLIPERGWAAVSTRILAERAGVSPSVVHYHFPSLPALLNEAVVGVIRQVLAELDAVLDTATTPAEVVDALLASVDRYTGADPMSLLSIEACLAATRDEGLRQDIADVLLDCRHRFGRWLAAREVTAPEETAAVLVAAVDGLLLQRGLGAGLDTGSLAIVLRRLVGEHRTDEPEVASTSRQTPGGS